MSESLQENSSAQQDVGGQHTLRGPSLPGDVGFWTFIAADATLFTLLFFQFSLDRSSHVSVFDEGQRGMLVPLGAINTAVLVTSSWLLASAVRAAHQRRTRQATRLIAGTVLLGILFVVLKVSEYQVELSSGHTVSTSSFFMYYFIITGIHLLHLIIGVMALVIIGLRVRRDTGSELDRVILECGASYWHLIDLLWMFIFPLIYLVR